MSEEKAQEVEAKETKEVVETKEVETKEVEPVVEKTIEETLEVEKERTVPESALIKHKKAEKALAKELKELKASIEDGAKSGEIGKTLDEISEKHDVSKAFLKDLISALTPTDIDDKIDSRLKPLTDEARSNKINTLFNKEYKRTLEAMPEFKDIVNKDVVKSLTLDPANRKKTFKSIIEDAYGHLLTGKKTLEKTGYKEGEKITSIDYKRAKKDVEYFKAIMANPALKEKYNKRMIN
jgi:hypothetical protein